MMNKNDLTSTERFFYENSSWLVYPGEDSEHSRIANAITEASAERQLQESSSSVVWTQQSGGWMAELVNNDGYVISRMPSVMIRDEDDPYKRVIEAKLVFWATDKILNNRKEA